MNRMFIKKSLALCFVCLSVLALYSEEMLRISFDYKIEQTEIEVTKGSKIILPKNTYIQDGYEFLFWYTLQEETAKIYLEGTIFYAQENTNFFAFWLANKQILIPPMQPELDENKEIDNLIEDEPIKTSSSNIKIGAYAQNQYALGKFRDVARCSIGGGVLAEFGLPLFAMDTGISLQLQGASLISNTESIISLNNFSCFVGGWLNLPLSSLFSLQGGLEYGFAVFLLSKSDAYEGDQGMFVDQALQAHVGLRYHVNNVPIDLFFNPTYTMYIEQDVVLSLLGFNAGFLYKL